MFSYEDVRKNTLEYFSGDELATNVFITKYCLRDSSGNFLELTPDDMHKRLAKEFARIESNYPNLISYETIYNLLKNFKYIIPGGSILYGLGNNYSFSSLGNCFVIGNTADSWGGISTTDEEQAQLMKRRAGVGHDLSHLRPKGSHVTNAAITSSGIVPFMEKYSNTTRTVAQDGRRGALMLSLDINHPESDSFITAKDDLTKVTGANISVKVNDKFMHTLLANPKPVSLVDNIKNYNIWNKLIHQAWKTAEPGVLFWDKIKSESIPSCYGADWQEVGTNPCGEIPLCPYDSCRLLSVNLFSYVEKPFTEKAWFNWDKFIEHSYIAQKLMDDIIDLENEKIEKLLKKIDSDPEDEATKATEKNLWLKIQKKLLDGRRTGLSAIGLGDMLAALNIKYDSEDSLNFAEEVYKQFAISAYRSSTDMAKDRGAFPIYDFKKEMGNPFINRVIWKEKLGEFNYKKCSDYKKYGRRNIALLTIPPSGSLAILAGITSGIEPVFNLYYKRRRKVNADDDNITFIDQNGDCWQEYYVTHPKLKNWFDANINDITWENFLKEDDLFLDTIKESPWYKSTANDVDPIQKVKLQGRIQKWVDHSISVTNNLPKDVTEEEVSNIYMEAWKAGCKGCTIYRDGSRSGVLISSEEEVKFNQHSAPKRPKVLNCDIYTPKIKGNKYVVVVGLLDNKPYEVFAFEFNGQFNLSKGLIKRVHKGRYDILTDKGEVYSEDITSDMHPEEEDKTRLISTSLRHGADIKFVVQQLNASKGSLVDFSKVIARQLKKYIKIEDLDTGEKCPECGEELTHEGGCLSCPSCGYSKCG
jgi:ribonucleoside-diphosphate reductase alpha chain